MICNRCKQEKGDFYTPKGKEPICPDCYWKIFQEFL